MKRKTLKLFAGILGMTVLLCITACGSSDQAEKASVTSITEDAGTEPEAQVKTESQDKIETPTKNEPQDKTQKQAESSAETETRDMAETPAETETKTENEETKEEIADDSKQYETLEDYFNEPEAKNTFDKQIASSSTDDITILCDVKGNELTCTLKFTNNSIIGANVDDIKAALDAGLEAQADSFKKLAKELDETIGKERACTIIVRYADLDGNVFAQKAFKAD